MAGWSDWYSGAMAPPLKVPGGYIPAPSVQAPMSVEEMYRGIIPSVPGGLSTRTAPTVPINPMTGMPYVTTASGGGQPGLGAGVTMSGAADVRKKVRLPNPVYGPDPVEKYQDRLPAVPAGLPLKSDVPGYASARGQLGASGFGSGTLTAKMPQSSGFIDLPFNAMSDTAGQNAANSSGKPVRYADGKVYYPTNGATDKIRAPMAPVPGAPRSAAPQRSTGLFGALFGGGSGGGLFGGGNPQSSGIGTSPSQGKAMVVSPGTPTGSTLESMGFSPGAVIPAATVRNLSERKYI